MTKNDFLRRVDAAILKVSERLKRTQARCKITFYARACQVSTRLRPGDFVYLDPTDGVSKPKRSTSSAIANSKLRPVAVGPFRVLSNDVRTVVIDRDGEVERVSADRVLYASRPPEALPSTTTPDDLASSVREGPTYVVDKLLDNRREADGKTWFLIKWAAYQTHTWEPRTHVPEKLVSSYFT